MPRILLVDDDIAEISAVKRVLARSGHQPVLATNASDAMAAMGQAPPDLLVIGSTCENGEALVMAGQVAAGEAGVAPMPIVVLGEAPGTPAGAVVVPRPIDPAQLAQEVATALGKAPPREPPAPGRPSSAAPVGRMTPAPARFAFPAPGSQGLPARAGPAAGAGARPPRASAPPRHDAPAAVPRAALSVEVTAALEPVGPRREASGQPRAPTRPAVLIPPPPPAPPPADPGTRRAAAAEALRARAEELRRGGARSSRPISEEVVDDELDALLDRVEQRPDRALADELGADLPELEPIPVPRRDPTASEAGRRQEAARRAEKARRVEAERAAEEARRRAAEAAAEEARRAREAEARAAEETRAAAEAKAAAEEQVRRRLEDELDSLRHQMEEERSAAEKRIAEERERADMDTLRRKGEEETRRRAEVEAELARLTEETSRRTAGPASTPPPLAYAFPEQPFTAPPLDAAEEEARLRAAPRRDRDLVWAETAPYPDAPELPPEPPALPPPELRSGTLADLPAPRLLALAWKARLGGRLDFQGAAARSIHFEGGRIVGATSADPSERLEELALRLGLVTREQYRQVAAAAAALPARRAALLLLERGFLKPTELTGLVRRRAEDILFGLFADESARFRWVGAEVPPEEHVGLDRGVLALAVEGVRRRWLGTRLEPVLGGDATLLTPIQGGPTPAELGLSAEERKVVALADGLRTLDEIEAASPLDPLSTRQILCALVLTGAITVRVLGAGRAAGLSAAAIDLARVREKLDQVRRADYFTILGVGRLCTPHEVRDASERLLAEFAPARFQGVREEGLPGRLEEIVRVVSDAREVLADERLREEYLKGLGE